MRVGRILDRQPSEQELVGLGVRIRLRDRVRHVVGLGEEPAGAQDHHGHTAGQVRHPAQLLGRELGDAVDVARLQRRQGLVDPGSACGTAAVQVDPDHQRGGRGEHEPADPGSSRGLE